MSDTVRLRTMTFKSTITDGKYRGWTVETLFKINPYSLRWMYYNLEKITFTEEVLCKLPKLLARISKPGIDHSQNLRNIYEDRSLEELKKIKLAATITKSGISASLNKVIRKKSGPKLLYSRSRNVMTPKQLINRNHGH